jgi:hypothetical protein
MLYPWRKSPWYLLVKRLVGLQGQPEHCRAEKNFLPLLGIKPRISSPIPTGLRTSHNIKPYYDKAHVTTPLTYIL